LCADEGIALRGLFIIDKEGVVQHATINNLAFGRSVDETLRTLQVCREASNGISSSRGGISKQSDCQQLTTPQQQLDFNRLACCSTAHAR